MSNEADFFIFYLKVFVPWHSSVGEFRQKHGNEAWKAPFSSQPAWADSRQPEDVLWHLRGFSLEHPTLAQTEGGWGQAAEAFWDRQAHAGEETPPSRWDGLVLSPPRGPLVAQEYGTSDLMETDTTFKRYYIKYLD